MCTLSHLRQSSEGKLFEAESLPLPGLVSHLALEDPGGGDRGHPHSVTEEEDYVLRHAGVHLLEVLQSLLEVILSALDPVRVIH